MWVWMLLTLFTLVGEWHGRCYGCLMREEERIGLLEIKSSINPYGFSLIDWVDTSNDSISKCCLDGLKNVEQLDLSGNKLEGSLPDCLGNLSSLQVLDISRNRFTGNIATGPLNNLISLEFLSLSNNLCELPLSFKSFSNHSKLKFFICDNCTLVEDQAGFWKFIQVPTDVFSSIYIKASQSTTNMT
uniref:Leucine-rich repeat-containing N-terminal plant-type domain-containing protein n=1 Tax=Salix viminalis TaxID=40686 RepID=A0A6N2LIM2_SALVM